MVTAALAIVALNSRALVTATAASMADVAVTERFALTGYAIEMIAARPLLGVGAGNFSLAELLPPVNANYVDPVHVVPLVVAAEAGIPAGLAWLGLILLPVYFSTRRRATDNDAFRYRLAIPDWPQDEARFLKRPRFPSGLESLKAIALMENPTAFRRGMIFFGDDPMYRPHRDKSGIG